MVIAGDILANLFASTTGTDGDWVVKLIDVYPEIRRRGRMDGYQLMVANEVLRGRFRKSLEKPGAARAGRDLSATVDCNIEPPVQEGAPDHGAGAEQLVPAHRPQPADVRAEHLHGARTDFQKATQRVYRSAKHPSRVVLLVAS